MQKCGLGLVAVVVRSRLGNRGVGWNGFPLLHGLRQALGRMGRLVQFSGCSSDGRIPKGCAPVQ